MENFNICLIKPDNYIHSYAFLELGELIYFSLKELGHEVTINFNKIEPSYKNVLIGCHLLDTKFMSNIPGSSVILNTEQVYSATNSWNKAIFPWAHNFEMWDYSKKNIEKFSDAGINNVKHFKIGFQKELVRLQESKNKDVDILFYGCINDRRKVILDKLEAAGLKVKTLFGVYGKERDEWVERSKLVLNLHFYDSQIFEIIRVFYLMTNSVAVVGEVNETTSIDTMCINGIYPAQYNDLIGACLEIINNENLIQDIQLAALKSISAFPQKIFTQEIISS